MAPQKLEAVHPEAKEVKFTDAEVEKHFDVTAAIGAEYADGPWIEVSCHLCKTRWAVHLGEYGEIDKGERNVLLAHHREHQRKGYRMRKLGGKS